MPEIRKPFYLILHYSVQNCGDGSAYPRFFESKELARFDQDNMDEGWGEPCTGDIVLKSDSPIICAEHVVTLEEKISDIEREIKENRGYKINSESREAAGEILSYGSKRYDQQIEGLEKQLEELKKLREEKNDL